MSSWQKMNTGPMTTHGGRWLKIGTQSTSLPVPPLATLTLYVLAGTTNGLLALFSQIPAAPLAGALLGACVLSISGRLETALLITLSLVLTVIVVRLWSIASSALIPW